MLLHLFGQSTPKQLAQSDAICTALQLINHWQDVAIDAIKGEAGRIYLPQDELARFNVTEDDLRRRIVSTNWRDLMKFQLDRARDLMLQGAPLGWALPGRFGMEIRAIVAGGLRVADKIEACDFDVFERRPTLKTWDWPAIFWATLVRPL